ncbi:hypothetical protein J4434_01280 [Candidatus Woesearchaeota archaeon]|nr:hypothetical protein [Candidatus Woesearchaeota archaeon]
MFKKKRIFISIIVLFILILVLPFTFSFDVTEETASDFSNKQLSSSDYSSPSAYPDIFSNPNFQVNQVPSQYVSQIPPDKLQGKTSQLKKEQVPFLSDSQIKGLNGDDVSNIINQLTPSQESSLTTDQLSHSNNLEEVSDLSNLNQKNMQNAAQIKFNIKLPDVDKNSHLTMDGDKLKTLEITFKNTEQLIMENPLAHDKPQYKYADEFKDTDGDGLTDNMELNNNLTDYLEIMIYPTDGNKYNTFPDAGFSNDKEFVDFYSTTEDAEFNIGGVNVMETFNIYNDLAKDSDGDGISDLKEFYINYNPENNDIDNDGLSDGYEIKNALDPKNPSALPNMILSKDCKDCLIKVKGNKEDYFKINFNQDSFSIDTNAKVSIGGKAMDYAMFTALDESVTSISAAQDNSIELTSTRTEAGYIFSSENTNSTITSNNYKEIVLGKSSKYETVLNDGVIYAELNSAGRYEYISIPMKSFAIVRKEKENYFIYIDKPSKRLSYDEYKNKLNNNNKLEDNTLENNNIEDNTLENNNIEDNTLENNNLKDNNHKNNKLKNKNSAYISAEEHIINLNGKVTFLKNEPYSFVEHPLYLSYDNENNAELIFDANNVYVNLTITNNNIDCSENRTISDVYSGMFLVSEQCINGKVERTGKFIEALPGYVKRYSASFHNGIGYFDKEMFSQETNERITLVRMISVLNYGEVNRLKEGWQKLKSRLWVGENQ